MVRVVALVYIFRQIAVLGNFLMFRLLAALVLAQLVVVPLARASCDLSQINKSVARSISGIQFDRVRASPVKGLCEATIDTRVFYVSEDGKYLFAGNLVSLQDGRNLTARATGKLTKRYIAHLDKSNMLIVGPRHPKRTLTVFTDVDCPYCARLHDEVPDLVRHGVRVRYLLYPRTGPGTQSYWRAVAVWCSKDPMKAMGIANRGGSLPMKRCVNPVRANFLLGQKLDISGTPTIFTDDGTRINGYLPAKDLLTELGISDTSVSQN